MACGWEARNGIFLVRYSTDYLISYVLDIFRFIRVYVAYVRVSLLLYVCDYRMCVVGMVSFLLCLVRGLISSSSNACGCGSMYSRGFDYYISVRSFLLEEQRGCVRCT